jgi:hypothetical protein
MLYLRTKAGSRLLHQLQIGDVEAGDPVPLRSLETLL